MKQECSIVRDLLPLYVEDMVSPETAAFVGEHLKSCETCQAEVQSLRQPPDVTPPTQEARPEAPLRRLQKKLLLKRIQTALLAGGFVLVILLSAFAILSAPRYVPYTAQLLEVTEQADGSLTITFDQAVTQCQVESLGTQEPDNQSESYSIQAWTSPWDQWFSHSGVRTLTIAPHTDRPVLVYYAQNNGQGDVLVYGEHPDGGMETLPRLVLGYYLFLAAGVFVVLLVVWCAAKKKPKVRQWVGRALLLPPAYGVGHLIVLGFTTVSYCATRDFILIVAIGAFVYCLVLLAVRIYRLWRELRPN
ncbi:zf-HC2 domain-containing protein [Pseudoflavonifractor sp. An187]|uniref:zf-HC2 domain-containing protein n=1 Tax=Pseudoflavonifractor sp. An187 TaxID=1965578 RepID=UPI000B3AE9E5|nr:zf-HC2 domain-containing protein [Pseudoflavonifractor sp. An187]OUP46016.1 hypothetical protein B5F22_01895 [Pseudoflavonifractor sp. An187]